MLSRSNTIVRALRLISTQRPATTTLTQQRNLGNCQKLNFYSSKSNSKPNSIVDSILKNNWSTQLEKDLKTVPLKYTHENVMYILKKLDKSPLKAFSFFNWVSQETSFIGNSSVYSLVLRILGNKVSMKEFWVVLKKMKDDGFYLDEETYVTVFNYFKGEKMESDATALRHFYDRMVEDNAVDGVVKKVVEVVLREEEWGEGVERVLEEGEVVVSDNFVIRVLKLLRSCPEKAYGFFGWLGGHSVGFEYSAVSYNAVARVLARKDAVEEFWSVVEEMKGAGHEMDYDSYIKITRQFQKCRMMEDAVKLYELMMDGPYRPSIQDCCILLRSLAGGDSPNLDLVYRVAKRYEETGNSLTKAVYDGIHRSLTSLGKFEEAEKITQAMRNAGYVPDNITHSQLVFGLCKARRFEDACKVLDEMQQKGCIPDIKTWTILIQGHCDANEVDKALLCFAKMIEKNCDPDADLLDVLVNGFLMQKKIDGAYRVLTEMVNFKVHLKPWQATYKCLICELLAVRKLEEAMSLLRSMKKQNYPPFPEPFVQYIAKFGTVSDALDFLKTLSIKDYPSISSYENLFNAFFAEGRHSEANDLLYKCPHHVRKHPKISQYFGSAKGSAPQKSSGSLSVTV